MGRVELKPKRLKSLADFPVLNHSNDDSQYKDRDND